MQKVMRKSGDFHWAGPVIIGMIAYAIVFVVSGLCWEYTLNTWLAYTGKSVTIEWWQGGFMMFVPLINKLTFPIAIATWIFFLFN